MSTPIDPDGDARPGTLDDGFNIIAKDLDRAFSIGLTTNQAVLMNAIRELSWTASLVTRPKGGQRPEPIPVKLNLTKLADGSGLNRSRLSTALKGLLAGHLLKPDEGGYLIDKHYADWLDDDGKAPRFTRSQIAWIRAAKKSKSRKKAEAISDIRNPLPLQNATVETSHIGEINGRLPLQNATIGHESAVAKCNSEIGALLQNATPTVADCNSDRCNLQQLHIEERAPEDSLDFKDIEDDLIPLPPSEPGSQPKRRYDLKHCQDYPGEHDLYDVESGPHAMEPEQARKIFRSLWQMFGVHEMCTDFYVRQCRYTHEVWVAAILQADRARSRVMSLRYVETIAQKYAAKGIPKEAPIVPVANGQPAPARKETSAERREREIHEAVERRKERDRANRKQPG